MTEVTDVLNQISTGDPSAADQLLPLVYDELRQLAANKLSAERPGQTLQPTALVHEAYLRLVGGLPDYHWEGRRHFFAAAAVAMRRILVDTARKKNRIKRGGQLNRQDLIDVPFDSDVAPEDILTLDEALEKLRKEDPEKAEIVELRFFAGLNHEQVGQLLGFSEVTARRHWRFARAWLRNEMGRELGG